MTKETIVNCWKKSGLIENNQSNEELNSFVEKERSKETEELDELLKLIGREEFFKQFVHPSLRTKIISSEDFINLEGDSESSIAILSDKEIINICRKESEDDTLTDVEEVAIAVTSKEAYEGFKAFSKYIEQSTTYDEQKLELLQKCEDCIFEVKQEQMKQTKINEYFNKNEYFTLEIKYLLLNVLINKIF